MKHVILEVALSVLFLLYSASTLISQTYLGNYISTLSYDSVIILNTETSAVRLIFYQPDIVRIDLLPTPTTQPDSSFVVIQNPSISFSINVGGSDSSIEISTSSLKIICQLQPLRFSFYNSSNKLLLSEPFSGGLATHGDKRIARFNLLSGDHFYGTGERGTQLDKRGLAFDSYNTAIGGYQNALPNMNANIPFLASSNGYALYFDNTYRGHYDLGKTNSSVFTYTADGGELTYYLIVSETISEQLEKYTWLTGRQPLPPKWALGFIQSKYGYRNEGEARSMVQTMRQKQIPCDAIILDLYWFQHMGDISWNTSAFPNPFGMMSDFLNQGIKTIVITEPYIIEPSINYSAAASNGYLGKFSANGPPYILTNWWSCNCNSYLLDLTNPAAQQWWCNKHPTFFGNELAGIWTDLGEPERHPDSMYHYLRKTPKVHNIFNNLWAKTVYDGFNAMRPNQRFFNLTRSGFAGIQRYGVSIWSGDVGRGFGGLAVQLPMMLNMGISGIAYHNSDIGGFCCGTTTPELYVRWMQYGTFCPITRAHGVDQPTEPWSYGIEAESISKKYIELRYQLLPYIYTLAEENSRNGKPLAYPLFFEDKDDVNLVNESSSYMWGNSFLVSPVVQAGQTSKSIYLPKGDWIDFWTDEIYHGKQTITVQSTLETMPIFVKAGSIIPMQFPMNYTDEHPLDTLRLAVYPPVMMNLQYSETLYEDDGKTLEYQSGSFAQTNFIQELTTSGTDTILNISVEPTPGTYTGKPSYRVYLTEIHSMRKHPVTVSMNGTSVPEKLSYIAMRRGNDGYYYDTLKNMLYIQTPANSDSSFQLRIENVRLTGVLDWDISNKSYGFRLERNYPNPFNPFTTIRYKVDDSRFTTLKVYNVLGDEVATLVNEKILPGEYQTTWDASTQPSGIYFCKMQTDRELQTQKLVVIK
ncbi:MAG: DUF4968 domain-containing protein [Ignavibacteriae bacterium]|nr:DUF4968 domain-containing protein [Ignavibacteriota bacterium]